MTQSSSARTDWGSLYRDHVAAVTALVTDLSDEQVAMTVPATPEWTVHDVLAHLAGVSSDGVNGRMDGAPGRAWTERHVGERGDVPVAELAAELRSNRDAIAASLVDHPGPPVVFDIATHHADLHEALGRGQLPEALWAPVLARVGPGRFGATIPTEVEPYELFRAIFSRRSRRQMQAWGLPLSPEQLDEVCVFGPREDDQPIPT